MSKILALREKRAAEWEKAKSFLDASRDENGLVSPENASVYDRLEASILSLGKEIERMERQAAIDAQMNAPTSEPIISAPSKPTDVKVGRASDEYKRDFFAAMRGRPLTNALQEAVDVDGGLLVPVEFERMLVAGLQEINVIRSLAKVITTSAERKIPVLATPSTATWVAENGAIPESDMAFAQKTIDSFKLTDLIKVSIELLQDSMFDLPAYLAQEFARAMGSEEERAVRPMMAL